VRPLYRHPWLRWLFLLVWRLRERDVEDVFVDTTGSSSPDYQHGKVSGLTPDLVVMSETGESPWVCCGYCSAGMACRAARKGLDNAMPATAHPIRSQGGRPHDNGSRASELRDGARRAWGVELDPLAVDEIPGRLRAGYAVVVNLDYADLPGWLRVQGGSFGHSCTLFGWREDGDLVGFYDPLWGHGARGAWAPWSAIRGALWGDGEHSSTTVQWPDPSPAPEPDPEPEPAPAPCPEPDVTVEDLEAAELAAHDAAVLERDRAWRGVTGWTQPRIAPAAWGSGTGWTRWSHFARFGPEPPADSWNGGAAWDGTTWHGDTLTTLEDARRRSGRMSD